MKKIDLGQAIGIFANIGVIAGIAMLAVELHQNNELLRNEARYNLQLSRSGELQELVQMPELSGLMGRADNGEELTQDERNRVGSLMLSRYIRWEWYYEQYRDGLVGVENIPAEAWRRQFANEWRLEHWRRASPLLSPDFVNWMEENVVNR